MPRVRKNPTAKRPAPLIKPPFKQSPADSASEALDNKLKKRGYKTVTPMERAAQQQRRYGA